MHPTETPTMVKDVESPQTPQELSASSPRSEKISFIAMIPTLLLSSFFFWQQGDEPLAWLGLILSGLSLLDTNRIWGRWVLQEDPSTLNVRSAFGAHRVDVSDVKEVRAEIASLWDQWKNGRPYQFVVITEDGRRFARSEASPGIFELVDSLVDRCRAIRKVETETDQHITFIDS